MTSVRKSYTFQSLLKNITLLPAEKFGNINLYQQTVSLKLIYDFRVERKKNSDMYFQLHIFL